MLESGEADLAWLNANYAEKFRGKDGYQNIDFTTADYRAVSLIIGPISGSRTKTRLGCLIMPLIKRQWLKVSSTIREAQPTARFS